MPDHDILVQLAADFKASKVITRKENKQFLDQLTTVAEDQDAIVAKVDSLYNVIMDPSSGLIVDMRKNTDFRERCEEDKEDTMDKFKEVLVWKGGIDKALWVIFAALIGVVIKMVFY